MADLPVTVHDVAFLTSPAPIAVSRVTLHPWCDTNRHPSTAPVEHLPPLAACMHDACMWVLAEAPGYFHGLLVHGVQHRQWETAVRPSVHTLQQYASRRTPLSIMLLPPPRIIPKGDSMVLLTAPMHGETMPKWVWHFLAASLIHEAGIAGTPPPAL